MKIALWVVQVLLAIAFVGSALMKLVTPYPELVSKMAWAASVSPAVVKLIGVVELAGAIGLIVPAATGIQPRLTPLAAIGLILVMLGAAGVHASIGEFKAIPVTLVLAALSAFVAWGRFKKVPVAARA